MVHSAAVIILEKSASLYIVITIKVPFLIFKPYLQWWHEPDADAGAACHSAPFLIFKPYLQWWHEPDADAGAACHSASWGP